MLWQLELVLCVPVGGRRREWPASQSRAPTGRRNWWRPTTSGSAPGRAASGDSRRRRRLERRRRPRDRPVPSTTGRRPASASSAAAAAASATTTSTTTWATPAAKPPATSSSRSASDWPCHLHHRTPCTSTRSTQHEFQELEIKKSKSKLAVGGGRVRKSVLADG